MGFSVSDKEELLNEINTAVNNHTILKFTVNGLVDILSRLDQKPITITELDNGETFSTDHISKYVDDGELFTDNPNYSVNANAFTLYDHTGRRILMVTPQEEIKKLNSAGGTFSIYCETEDDREKLADFLIRLSKCKMVKYPDPEKYLMDEDA